MSKKFKKVVDTGNLFEYNNSCAAEFGAKRKTNGEVSKWS